MKALTLREAAKKLNMHYETLRHKAIEGEIPGCKPGKSWLFIEEHLDEWVRSKYTGAAKVTQGHHLENKKWHYEKEVKSGGRISHIAVREYDSLVKQLKSQKRNNIMTS